MDNFEDENLAMFTNSLRTYSFHMDDVEAESIRKALTQEGLASNILQKSALYPSPRSSAVQTLHHGEPLGDPVALDSQLTLAENLGQRGLVDAYTFGGARAGLLKLSRQKICGQWVAVALAIAEPKSASIEESELRQALQSIKEARAADTEWEIRNLSIKEAVASIHRLNRSTGANLQFAAQLKV